MTFLKYLTLAALFAVIVTASDPFFGIELFTKPASRDAAEDVVERTWMSTEAFRPYLLDKDDRVSDLFPVTPFYYPTVHFWFLIYTQFESTSVVIHDKNNLSIIYKVLDFSALREKGIPRNTLYVLQQKLSKEKLSALRNDLDYLVRDPFSLTPAAKKIYQMLFSAKVSVPIARGARQRFFRELRDNIRTQTGQKNFIRDGIVRSLPYQRFLTRYFVARRLPRELLAIPFLESSFNPKAQSKVNALGIWQFMPLISSYYVPRSTKNFDYRFNVGVASVAAGFLLSENYSILKSWDLAVTAYNSGTKHLLKTRRELGRTVSLEDVIRHSDSRHFGFASKNFYSEFLALAHTLAYQEELFDDIHASDRPDVDDELRFFLSKCALRLDRDLPAELTEELFFHNHHTSNGKSAIPKGFIVTSKRRLPTNKFLEVPFDHLTRKRPKDWGPLLGRQSCSTR
jgi:membrane-bound lytic murein transglycosylase D